MFPPLWGLALSDIVDRLMGMEPYLTVVWIHPSLITNEVNTPYLYLWVTSISFHMKYLCQLSLLVFNVIINVKKNLFLCIYICTYTALILHTKSLSPTCIKNMVSHFVACPVSLNCFWWTEVLNFHIDKFINLVLYGFVFRKLFPTSKLQYFPMLFFNVL